MAAARANNGAGPGEPVRRLVSGTTLDGYTVERFIAPGSFGDVYEVRDAASGRRCAMKLLHPELRDRSDGLIQFLRQGPILDRLRHRNIVELYHVGLMPDGRGYLVTELLPGQSLAGFIAHHGKLDVECARALLAPICQALAFAHGLGVVHRDVKASKVTLVNPAGASSVDLRPAPDHREPLADVADVRVVVGDFALARILEGDRMSITAPMVVVGDATSMSPEQIVGDAITPRTDVYGLGCLAFHMLTGQLPFASSTAARTSYMHLHGDRPAASALAAVGHAVDEVIARAMARAPEARFASPEEFFAALEHASERVGSRHDARSIPAIGLLVEVRCSDDADDEESLGEIDAILERAEQHLSGRGFEVALETSNHVLFIRTIAGDEVAARRDALDAAAALMETIQRRPCGVHTNLVLHHDSVQSSGGQIRGGDLTDLTRWMPRGRVDGVVGTPAALEGLGLALELVDGEELLRPSAPGTPPDPGSPIPAGGDVDAGAGSRERLMHSQMMARIGRQAAGIVHDLRSPLNVVAGNLEFMDEKLDAGEVRVDELRAALADATRAIEQMRTTISAVLKASKVKSYDDDRRVIPVRDVIESAVQLAVSETRKKATVEVSCRGSASVLGAPGRLTQALVNLLVNAAQAIPETGRINVDAVVEDSRVTIAVRDSGEGMTEELQAQIFEPFFTTKSLDQGTGLGLSLVKEIITEHGGTIALESRPGIGTCFVITLPEWRPPRRGA